MSFRLEVDMSFRLNVSLNTASNIKVTRAPCIGHNGRLDLSFSLDINSKIKNYMSQLSDKFYT